MNRKNWVVIAIIVLAAAMLLAATLLKRPMTAVEEDTVIISVDGKEYARVPLSKPRTVTVTQEDGSVMWSK